MKGSQLLKKDEASVEDEAGVLRLSKVMGKLFTSRANSKEADRMLRLKNAMEELFTGRNNPIVGCVVVNDRGLTIVERMFDGHSKDSLAAMTALLSETGERANSNLQLGDMQSVSIRASEGYISVHDFRVDDQTFRIGAVVKNTNHRNWWWFPFWIKMTPKALDNRLKELTKRITQIMTNKT
jgi:predicted regulator of Ras-like GTPase activity (Roadblock/LC7/MglB family)